MPVQRVQLVVMGKGWRKCRNLGSGEVSPADIGVGKGGILLPGTAQTVRVHACVCVGKDWAERCALSTPHRDRVPRLNARLE